MWNAVWKEYEGFTIGEKTLLEQTCHVADTIDRLIAAIKTEPATVEGSRGQVRPNPLLREIREERALLKQLLVAIGLPPDDLSSWDGLTASERARRAAMSRWRQ